MKVNFFNQPYVLYEGDWTYVEGSPLYIGAATDWSEEPLGPPQAVIIITKPEVHN